MSRPPTRQHEAYADLVTPLQMQDDARATGDRLGLADRAEARLAAAARAAVHPAPSLRFDDHPTDAAKPQVEISAATARLASAIYGD